MHTHAQHRAAQDLDWLELEKRINFGPERLRFFRETVEHDVAFLKSIDVMDYSLLVGVHDLRRGNIAQIREVSFRCSVW